MFSTYDYFSGFGPIVGVKEHLERMRQLHSSVSKTVLLDFLAHIYNWVSSSIIIQGDFTSVKI
jgi:hypothetical protein